MAEKGVLGFRLLALEAEVLLLVGGLDGDGHVVAVGSEGRTYGQPGANGGGRSQKLIGARTDGPGE